MKIAIFCSANENIDPDFFEMTEALGRWMAENHHDLIFGGTNQGLMNCVAKAVHDGGGRVIGVVPSLVEKGGRMTISIAKDYTKYPGGRFIKEGDYSGEDFRINYLKPWYLKSKECGELLVVDLDGGYGYGSSFLEEAFGGLARELNDRGVESIRIISNEEPRLIESIKQYMREALEKTK